MNRNYWKKQATPWVSFAVLSGGMMTALILFFLVRIENQINLLSVQISDLKAVDQSY